MAGIIDGLDELIGIINVAAGSNRESAQNALNNCVAAHVSAVDARQHMAVCSSELDRYGNGF